MLDTINIRAQFPALSKTDEGRDRIYLDNPAGTQVPQAVIRRMTDYFENCNANSGGAFVTARNSDAVKAEARRAMADLLNAPDTKEIIFGPNMTTLTYSVSRALGRKLKPGDEIILTRMDHDANVYPWLQLAQDVGAIVKFLPFDTTTYQYNLDDLQARLSSRTKIVAICHASNAIGTINDVAEISKMVHAAGALVYVDAVQSAPHMPLDVQRLGCDFLACSAYKFFGPHQGILWGKGEILNGLESYQVRPAKDTLPGKFETGTQSHEGMAGVLGALEYLAWVGETMAAAHHSQYSHFQGRQRYLHAALASIQAYEQQLSHHLIAGLQSIPGIRVRGITDKDMLSRRVPTVSITIDGITPEKAAELLGRENIFVWSGHYYAIEVIQHLGLSESGGMLRIGMAHYNTREELDRLLSALESLKK